MSVQIDPLPPVPQHTPPLDGPGKEELTRKTPFSVTWMSWFIQLKIKVDTINGLLANLAAVTGTGLLAKIGDTSWIVRTLTGTTNRVTVTNGDGVSGNPTVDIAATYVGQTSIVTLGTVTTGTWNATAVGAIYGGTGFTTYTLGDIIYSNGANTLAKLPIGSNGEVLTVVAGAPAWASGGAGGSGANAVDTNTLTTISTSRSAGAETISFGSSTTVLGFRSSTAGTGTYALSTLAGAITVTIPSGATLGINKAATATVTIASPGVVTYTSHRMRPDDAHIWSTTGALPTGITAGTTYYVSATGFTFNSFQFSTTVGGGSVNTSGSQSGTHTLTWTPKPARVWVVAANDAGTVRLGVIRATDNNGHIYPIRDFMLTSSTAISAAADSSGVIYSDTAWTSMPTRVVGFLEYTLGVAGTWDAAPTLIQLWGKGIPLPGDTVQCVATNIPTQASGSTLIPGDTSTPQITEGDKYFEGTLTPTSRCNVLDWHSEGSFECSSAANPASCFFKDSEVNALNAIPFYIADNARAGVYSLRFRQFVPTVSSMTGQMRAGSGGGTMQINTNVGGTFTYGGCFGSHMQITELMG